MRKIMLQAALLAAVSHVASAAVSEEEANRLGQDLTPVGALKAGNGKTDPSVAIPEWDGDYQWQSVPEARRRYPESYPGIGDQKVLFTIDRSNYEQYRDRLSPGHIALIEAYDTYKLPVYGSVRTARFPEFFNEATRKNATNARLENFGESLAGAITGVPFPIPGNGQEIIWNHKTRYRGQSVTRYNTQLAVQTNGSFTELQLQEDVLFSYNLPGAKPEDLDNVMTYFLQLTTAPPRIAGQILLVHETMDQMLDTRRAWLYNPGQRRVRRAPNVAYDNPGTGSDGLRTNDQLDVFNGATDRYEWKLIGKKEMYIPYNAYQLADNRKGYKDLTMARHMKPDNLRYELHRVWVVDSFLREGTSHIYKRRTFYVDEDTWTIALVDIYDARDQLWRVQEYHSIMLPWLQSVGPAGGAVFDLQSGRYLVMELSNQEPLFEVNTFDANHFRTQNMVRIAQQGRRR
ncbi:MAG: DUF1329 domain-containing protein [Oceanococcaceae bacterium]